MSPSPAASPPPSRKAVRVPGETRKPVPRLRLAGPLALGFGVAIAFFGAGLGSAAYFPIDKGVGLPGTFIVETRTKAIQHQRGGIVGRILVVEGQDVTAGQVLLTFDTEALDQQITALKAQADAARRQLALIREEATTMGELLSRKLAPRSKVLSLERQVAEIEKEMASLEARILIAEQELARAEIRAPVAGRILSLAVTGAGAIVQPGGTVAEIVPQMDRLVIEGRLQPNQIDNVKPGMPAKVWLAALSWREQRPLTARLAWVSPDSVEDRRTGQSYYVARVELSESRAEIGQRFTLHPGMRSEILLLTGQRTILEQLVDPILKNVNRAFRG